VYKRADTQTHTITCSLTHTYIYIFIYIYDLSYEHTNSPNKPPHLFGLSCPHTQTHTVSLSFIDINTLSHTHTHTLTYTHTITTTPPTDYQVVEMDCGHSLKQTSLKAFLELLQCLIMRLLRSSYPVHGKRAAATVTKKEWRRNTRRTMEGIVIGMMTKGRMIILTLPLPLPLPL
jgi:hypothetical protein